MNSKDRTYTFPIWVFVDADSLQEAYKLLVAAMSTAGTKVAPGAYHGWESTPDAGITTPESDLEYKGDVVYEEAMLPVYDEYFDTYGQSEDQSQAVESGWDEYGED